MEDSKSQWVILNQKDAKNIYHFGKYPNSFETFQDFSQNRLFDRPTLTNFGFDRLLESTDFEKLNRLTDRLSTVLGKNESTGDFRLRPTQIGTDRLCRFLNMIPKK